MAQNWKTEITEVNDPLANYQGQPIISRGSPTSTYLGRVVLELWQEGSTSNDADGLAVTADAVNENHNGLLQRVAAALPIRVSRMKAL